MKTINWYKENVGVADNKKNKKYDKVKSKKKRRRNIDDDILSRAKV